MKKTIVGLVILLMAAAAVNAQQPDQNIARRHHKAFRAHGHDRLAEKLHFTDQQKAQLKNINSDYHKKLSALKQHEDITVKEMKAQLNTLRKDHKTAIQALLTPQQKDQLVKMKEERAKMAKLNAGAQAEKIKIKLGLTDAQARQLTSIRTDMSAKMNAIHSDNSLSREQKHAQFKLLVTAQKEQLKDILTPEQLQHLEQLKQQQHRRNFTK